MPIINRITRYAKAIRKALLGGQENNRNVISINKIVKIVEDYPNSFPLDIINEISSIIDSLRKVEYIANDLNIPVSIIGDFTVGKSSFVNALLSNNLMPVSQIPTTAIITKIKYSAEERAEILFKDGHQQRITLEEYKDMSAYTIHDEEDKIKTGKSSRFDDILEATIFVNSIFLKNNRLYLFDTLGLSESTYDTNKTIEAIKYAVAVIYICSQRGLSEKDKSFITSSGLSLDNLFLCINKIDLIKNDKDKKSIVELANIRMNSLMPDTKKFERVYPISAKYKLISEGLESEDNEIVHNNFYYEQNCGFSILTSNLLTFIKNNSAKIKLNYVKEQLNEVNKYFSILSIKRETEFNALISKKERDLQFLKNRLSKLEQEIKLIDEDFKSLFETVKSVLIDFSIQYDKNVNKQWPEAEVQILGSFSFTNSEYIKLLNNEDKLFRFGITKDTKAVEILKPFTSQIFKFLSDVLQSIWKTCIYEMENIVAEFYNKKEYEKPDTITTINNCSLEETEIITTMSKSIRKLLQDDRQIFSGLSAKFHKFIGSESNNNSRKVKMAENGKETAMKVIHNSIKIIVNNTKESLGRTIGSLNSFAKKNQMKEFDNISNSILTLNDEIKRYKEILIKEKVYFSHCFNDINVDNCVVIEGNKDY